jgi:thioesterase domain-containing protein
MQSQKMIEYRAWIDAWLAKHPLPEARSKKAHWRVANLARLEMRRLEERQERETAKAQGPAVYAAWREAKRIAKQQRAAASEARRQSNSQPTGAPA